MMTMAVSPMLRSESVTVVTGVCVEGKGTVKVKEWKGEESERVNQSPLHCFTFPAGSSLSIDDIDKACRTPENRRFVQFFSRKVFP
jgi:hypothetical protein